MQPFFLFSIDLEDIRQLVPGGDRLTDRLEPCVDRMLAFLEDRGARITFFTTGDVARRYPDLVRRVAAAGHEIGCHTSDHVTLDRLGPERFRDDLKRCRDDFARAGVDSVEGFRAPVGSLTKETRWAYDVLREISFVYSSSVLPAHNPLFGWPDFGSEQPRFIQGLWEIPMTLTNDIPRLRVPFAGGVYLRVLPFFYVKHHYRKRLARGELVLGYMHPYDIDSEQERFMFPEIKNSRFYNWLMYRGRERMLDRVGALMDEGAAVMPYRDFVASELQLPEAHG